MLNAIRAITFVLTIVLGVVWAFQGEFMPWGLSCLISAVLFLISVGGDATELWY